MMRVRLTILLSLILAAACETMPQKTKPQVESACADNITYHTSAGWPMSVIDREEYFQYMNSFCTTQQGTWIVSVTTRHNGVFMVYTRRSEDKGRTWSNRIYAYDASKYLGEGYNCEMGQLFPVPGTNLIYQFHITRKLDESVRFGKLCYSVSTDDGCTWHGPDGPNSVWMIESPVYELVGDQWGWHLMAPPRVMSDGMMYLPMNASTDPRPLADIRSEVVFMRSRDIMTATDPSAVTFDFTPPPPHGIHSPLDRAPEESQGMEAQILELTDGRYIAALRTGNGVVDFTISDDHGDTWTTSRPFRRYDDGPVVKNPNCACPFNKLSDGRYVLLHTNNMGDVEGATSGVYHARLVRAPIYVSVGVDAPAGSGQPIVWSEPRLMTTLDGFWKMHDDSRPHNDLTYGHFHEESPGEYYHFYNARWESIQVNRIDPALLTPPEL